MSKNQEESLPVVKLDDIETVLEELLKMYKSSKTMREKCKKTFALGGRIIGDVGECLVSYLFGMRLTKRQTPGYDGIAPDGNKVEIKVRTKDDRGHINHIHVSDSTITENPKGCYLVVLSFVFGNKQPTINVEINTWMPQKKWKDLHRTNGFVTFGALQGVATEPGLSINSGKARKIGKWIINR